MNDKLPDLEIRCEKCNGTGGERWINGKLTYCSYCKGAGYVPTEDGKKILAIIGHNLRFHSGGVSFFNE